MDLLHFNIPEWFFVAINLFILICALQRILWKPINRILDERQALLEQGLLDADEAQVAKTNMERDREAFQADLDRRSAEQMQIARTQAGRDYDRIVAEAEERARKLVSAAHLQAEHDRAAMLASAKTEIIALSLEAAGMLMKTNMDNEQNRCLIEHYLEEKEVSV